MRRDAARCIWTKLRLRTSLGTKALSWHWPGGVVRVDRRRSSLHEADLGPLVPPGAPPPPSPLGPIGSARRAATGPLSTPGPIHLSLARSALLDLKLHGARGRPPASDGACISTGSPRKAFRRASVFLLQLCLPFFFPDDQSLLNRVAVASSQVASMLSSLTTKLALKKLGLPSDALDFSSSSPAADPPRPSRKLKKGAPGQNQSAHPDDDDDGGSGGGWASWMSVKKLPLTVHPWLSPPPPPVPVARVPRVGDVAPLDRDRKLDFGGGRRVFVLFLRCVGCACTSAPPYIS